MAFDRPALSALIARAETDVQARLGTGGPLLRRSVLSVLARVLAGGAHLLHGHVDWASRQLLPDTADAEGLERWASLLGLSRKSARASSGPVAFYGVDGAKVQIRRRLRRGDGVEYVTDAAATIANGIAVVPVTCATVGAIGDAPLGTQLVLTATLSGVQSTGYAVEALAGGFDVETDDALRERVLQRLREPPAGGAAADYVRWALEVEGVTRAFVFPRLQGPGTVGLTFTVDDATTGPIPGPAKVAEVAAHVNANRPVGAQPVVFAPQALPVAIAVQLVPNTAAVQAEVLVQLAELFRRAAVPGAPLYLSDLRAAVSAAPGEVTHTLQAPAADVLPAIGQLPTLGSVTFT